MRRSLLRLMIVSAVLAGVLVPVSADAATPHGRWTDRHLVITASRLGAVRTTMTLQQASRAAGVRLRTGGDGEYSSPRAPGLIFERRSPSNCVAAYRPAHVRAASGATFGWTLARLRRAYGHQLHFHTGPGGISDPTSYYVRDGRNILFFHLAHGRSGTVQEMAAGRTFNAAYC